jgi:phosphoserine phosphatase
MVYQPMLEVLSYLRANDFKNFIVSGGGIEFMRAWTERVWRSAGTGHWQQHQD